MWFSASIALQVPGGYLLTDIILMLDRKLGKKALKPDLKRHQTKMSLAAEEAVKAKRLLGALRSLWRSSAIKGQDGNITHLKSFLSSSPQQQRNVGTLPLDPPAEGRGDEGTENGVDDGRSDDESDGSSSFHSDPSDHPECDDEYDEMPAPSNRADTAGAEEVDCSQATSIDSSGAASGGTLDASTLQLGTPTPPSPASVVDDDSDSENFRDSQIPGAGWMGQAMIASRHLEKEEKERMEIHNRLTCLVSSIREMLGYKLFPAESAEGVQMEDYAAWCYQALKKHGEVIYDKLVDVEFFKRWALQQKKSEEEDWHQKTKQSFCRDGPNTNCNRFAK